MYEDFLKPQTLAALGATQFTYSQRFTIAASTGGAAPLFAAASPGTGGSGSISIDGGLHFFTERVFIGFPTVYNDGAAHTVDDGVCRITLLVAAGGTIPLSSNPVLLSLLGVPDRQNTPGAVDITTTGQPGYSQAPHIQGFKWNNFLAAGGKLTHQFANLSNRAARIDVNWVGWNIPTQNCRGTEDFWAAILKYQAPPFGH